MALIGYGILVCLFVYGLYFGLRCLYFWKKKKPLFSLDWWKKDTIDFGVNLLFVIVFSFVVVFAFGGFTLSNAILYQATLSIVCVIARPSHLYELVKEKLLFTNENRRRTIFTGILFLFVLIETFGFNARAFTTNVTATDVLLDDTSIKADTGVTNGDGSVTYKANQYFVINLTDTSNTRLFFDFADSTSKDVTVTFYSASDALLQNPLASYLCNPVVKDANIVSLPNLKSYPNLKVVFTFNGFELGYGDDAGVAQTATLRKITLDAPILFYYSALRFVAASLLAGGIIYISYFAKKGDEGLKSVSRKWEVGILIGGAFLFFGYLIYACSNTGSTFFQYPLKNPVEQYDIFTQMFDAFKKGQFNIDVNVGAGYDKLWDHAYFDGKCYSYYGVLPVLLISFPLYFLTGMVPRVVTLETLGAILEVQVFLILIVEICKVFFKKMNPRSLGFILFVSFFTALSLGLVTYKSYYIGGSVSNPCVEGIYHIPVIYGLLSLDLFILMSLFAYENKKLRMMFLGFAGLAFVFIMASRPDLFVGLIFVAPLFIKMLLEKDETILHRLLNFVPMFIVLLVGACLIAFYNYSRFDSIIEYGQRYQNTISDQTDLSVHLDQIFPALFHYFLNPWFYNSSVSFPFIGTTNPRVTADGSDYSFYLNYYAGVFSIPLFLSILTLPFNLKTGDKWLNAFAVLLPIAMAVLAIITYCFAGLCPRYMFEMYHLATLEMVISVFKFLENRPQAKSTWIPIVFALALVSVFVCWNLSRDPFFGLSGGDLNGWLLRIREAFGYFNV